MKRGIESKEWFISGYNVKTFQIVQLFKWRIAYDLMHISRVGTLSTNMFPLFLRVIKLCRIQNITRSTSLIMKIILNGFLKFINTKNKRPLSQWCHNLSKSRGLIDILMYFTSEVISHVKNFTWVKKKTPARVLVFTRQGKQMAVDGKEEMARVTNSKFVVSAMTS
jgi:hypothetical protein